jgi:hypothetical protein
MWNDGVDWICWLMIPGCCEHGDEFPGSIKRG